MINGYDPGKFLTVISCECNKAVLWNGGFWLCVVLSVVSLLSPCYPGIFSISGLQVKLKRQLLKFSSWDLFLLQVLCADWNTEYLFQCKLCNFLILCLLQLEFVHWGAVEEITEEFQPQVLFPWTFKEYQRHYFISVEIIFKPRTEDIYLICP